MNLATTDLSHLTPCTDANGCKIRRDLHTFVSYVEEREIKRAHRDNSLRKADLKKLASRMSIKEVASDTEDNLIPDWIDYVDSLALELGFVSYDTRGEYMGHSSTEPSYPDNYIEVNSTEYDRFLALPLLQQETRILTSLTENASHEQNEFYQTGVLGRLDGFECWGCATGVMPAIEFPKARRFLLELLSGCKTDTWYTTASLIAHLKKEQRLFLIPKYVKKQYGKGQEPRYGNFQEFKGEHRYSGERHTVTEKDHNAFERVEGRYVERFLEGIPFVLGYVDIAYDETTKSDLHPALMQLKAFRVKERLAQVCTHRLPEPKVWVQPNFEVYDIFLNKLLESKCYVSPNKADLTITVSDSARPEISKVMKTLRKDYKIGIKDI